jgi:hypothetical protein
MAIIAKNLEAKDWISGVQMGMSSQKILDISKDISNPNSWEETEFELHSGDKVTVFEETPKKCVLTFYNDRLYKIQANFPKEKFDYFYNLISTKLGKPDPKSAELDKKERSVSWYGEYKDDNFTYVLNLYEFYDDVVISYSEDSQKSFHFSDLWKGSTPWIILSLVGLFSTYLLLGYLLTSYCPNCHSFNLEIVGKTYTNPTDYDPSLFGRDVHWDEIYHYRCKKCKYEKNDRYSGFWSWYRNKD